MNTSHESFLAPFFKEMNLVFPTNWCVLHSYDTLPFYSSSDVDMAFSGSDINALELLIQKVANATGWVLLQKLWYDVPNCNYYVLHHSKSDTLVAIDFLIDNDAIGKYGFTTKTLTRNCTLVRDSFPIPNSEVAFCYKLIKRIVKKRSIEEDDAYLRITYQKANQKEVDKILSNQLGKKGKELILKYLTDKNKTLSSGDITLLHQLRKTTLSSFNKKVKFSYWEYKRKINRIFKPSGLLLSTAQLDKNQVNQLTNLLEKKLDILFRFVKVDSEGSSKLRLKAFAGSTLVICPAQSAKLKTTWLKTIIIKTKNTSSIDVDSIEHLAELYYNAIIDALEQRMKKRMPSAN